EAGLSAARTLADAGLEVFLFGTSDKPVREPPAHPNIHAFEGAIVTGVSGTLGNFHISLESGDFRQTLQVGGVILGERLKNISLYHRQENMPGRVVSSAMQKSGVPGTPFFYPGQTSISGLFLADPPAVNISKRKKGAAAAVLAAAQLPLGPRQIRGYTVEVNEDLCRGCGRCMGTCPYQAITFQANAVGGWSASVDEALCKGCGNCISVCPSNAADSPYRNQVFLEEAIEEVLTDKRK
ncbi:MAG: 4Fe-4S dicluster domain-containing protein, partial [Desulfobacterales bacterium]|nr:4Fe-4S dicluster domain-containing protein [Desulfobacterales bacterium]